MVIDFGDLKKIAEKYIEDKLDHGFMIWDKDMILVNFFSKNKDQKSIIVPFVPTAENIAYWVFNNLDKRLQDKYNTGLKLHSIKVWETPTSSAICTRGDI
jgi:6-pyruvoyltetrahydropterin/6-carboxytetrahydropterin synthase